MTPWLLTGYGVLSGRPESDRQVAVGVWGSEEVCG